MKPNILAILGPTAVGKTDFFLKLVNQGYPFEAILADSRQIYRYMDIGTGKDLPLEPELKQKFWLVDSVNPDQKFSSANFYAAATAAAIKIYQNNNIPVLVGGTGRYIADFESPPETLNVPPDFSLRSRLENMPVVQLQQILIDKNPDRFGTMNNSDKHNPRRLIRAIETVDQFKSKGLNIQNPLNKICLTAPLQLIKVRIATRVSKRIDQGMIQEVEHILRAYPNFFNYQASDTPGYQEISSYLSKQISLDAAIEKWIQREIDYAKRQLTWLKKQSGIIWFDITSTNWYADAVIQLGKWGYGRSNSQN